MVMKSVGFSQSLEQFLAPKNRFTFITFDPTDHPVPEPLKVDLWWLWMIMLAIVVAVIAFGQQPLAN
jgi:hypothetical protein